MAILAEFAVMHPQLDAAFGDLRPHSLEVVGQGRMAYLVRFGQPAAQGLEDGRQVLLCEEVVDAVHHEELAGVGHGIQRIAGPLDEGETLIGILGDPLEVVVPVDHEGG